MATKPKSAGRAMLSAFIPSEDDPRLMSVDDVVKAADELTSSADTVGAAPAGETLDSLTDRIWAKHNARPAHEPTPSPEPASHHDVGEAHGPRNRKEPNSLEDIHASAWSRFNNPPKGQSLQRGAR